LALSNDAQIVEVSSFLEQVPTQARRLGGQKVFTSDVEVVSRFGREFYPILDQGRRKSSTLKDEPIWHLGFRHIRQGKMSKAVRVSDMVGIERHDLHGRKVFARAYIDRAVAGILENELHCRSVAASFSLQEFSNLNGVTTNEEQQKCCGDPSKMNCSTEHIRQEKTEENGSE
jgi:hypothetical protein